MKYVFSNGFALNFETVSETGILKKLDASIMAAISCCNLSKNGKSKPHIDGMLSETSTTII